MLPTAISSFARRVARVGMLAALFSAVPAGAEPLYTAEVELDRRASQPRIQAYDDALRVVLRRVSGSSLAADSALIDEIFPDPAAFVVRFGPGEDGSLIVTFDGDAIERRLRQSGQLVWGRDRPTTLVWLAVDFGAGRREFVSSNDSAEDLPPGVEVEDPKMLLRERVLEVASERGLPVLFPLLDAEDLRGVSLADVWGGFDAPVLDASTRYGVDSILVGRLYADRSRVNRWTFIHGGEQSSFTGEPEQVLNAVADRLADEYAIGGNDPLRKVDLSISGITSVEDFASVQLLLRDVAVIDTSRVVGVDGDRVDYRVTAYGGSPRLARALRLKGLLEEERIRVPGDFSTGFEERLDFFYSAQ